MKLGDVVWMRSQPDCKMTVIGLSDELLKCAWLTPAGDLRSEVFLAVVLVAEPPDTPPVPADERLATALAQTRRELESYKESAAGFRVKVAAVAGAVERRMEVPQDMRGGTHPAEVLRGFVEYHDRMRAEANETMARMQRRIAELGG